MKKLLAASAIAVFLSCILLGCGNKGENFVGNWEASEMIVNNTTVTDLMGIPLNAVMRFELKKGGSAEWISPMDSIASPEKDGVRAKWKAIDDDSATLTISQKDQDDNVINLELKDGKIVIDSNGAQTYLVKVDEFTPVDEEALNDIMRKSFSGMLSGN